MELLILLFSAIATFAMTWLLSTGKIVDNRRKRWKWVNSRGWQVIACGIITIVLLVIQYLLGEKKENEIKRIASIEQDKRDSVNTANVIFNFSDAFGRYGYKI